MKVFINYYRAYFFYILAYILIVYFVINKFVVWWVYSNEGRYYFCFLVFWDNVDILEKVNIIFQFEEKEIKKGEGNNLLGLLQ